MEFASDHVYCNVEEEYECVSDDEFHEGMQLSDSDSGSDIDDKKDKRTSQSRSAVRSVLPWKRKSKARKEKEQKSEARKDKEPKSEARNEKQPKSEARHKKQHHWKSADVPLSEPIMCHEIKPIMYHSSNSSGQKWFRKADTNVVSVNFSTLLSPSHMHAGDPVACSSCQAILSHISKTEGDTENKRWKCEFCDNEMHVDIEDEEIAKDEDVTYLMEPSDATKSTTLGGHDESLVIFCVDTSGSMCVTTEVEGKVKLRGTGQLQRLESFNTEGEDQYLPSQKKRNVSYISRLQSMQAAVDDQLGTMAKDVPNRRVGLITFSSDVTVVGDGHQKEVTMAGDKLTKMDQLIEEGSELTLPQAIRTSRNVLGDKVYKLEEGGSTALGPALVIAVSMASHHPGSKVILCTDGKANIGLGKLEDGTDEESANEFYTNVGEKAVSKGVSISVITIKGTDCKLVHLGQLADKTGGQVNIVDPLNLTKEFKNILADPIIATNVKAKFLVHKALYVLNDDDPNQHECYAEFSPGNVKSSSSITFEFGRRQTKKKASSQTTAKLSEKQGQSTDEPTASSGEPAQAGAGAAAAIPSLSSSSLKDYPFQLQIHYTDTEGSKALRVITKTLPATNDRKVAEKNANMQVLGVHAAKKSADLALQGQYTRSRGVALMNQRFAWRKSHGEAASKQDRKQYKNIFSKLKGMENLLQRKQQSEIEERGMTRSDSEGEDVEECLYHNAAAKDEVLPIPLKKEKEKHLQRMRSSEMDDVLANMAYNLRHASSDQMTAPLDEETEDLYDEESDK